MNSPYQPAGSIPASGKPIDRASHRGEKVRKGLLLCGILSSLLHIAMNVAAPMLYEGYNVASQTVSELSAIGAPTRPFWTYLGFVYTLLLIAFGFGVWMSAGQHRRLLRVAGVSLMVQGAIGPFWPPMNMRGVEPTMTDTLHVVFAMVALLLMTISMGFGAAAMGKRFQQYSLATLAVFVVFGILTGMESPGVPANLPTPTIGIWERVNMLAFLLWVIALAAALLRSPALAHSEHRLENPLRDVAA